LSSAARSSHAVGVVLAMLGAMAFSGKAIIVKLSYRYGVDAVTVIMYRMLLALPLFIAVAWWAAKRDHAQNNPLSRRDWLAIGGLGFLGYYLASFLDFIGLQYITASLERLIIYLNPTLVMLLGALLYKHPLNAQRIWAMVISYCGVLLVFAHEVSLAGPGVVIGSAFVLASAISYALYLMFSGELVQRIGAALTAQTGMVGPMATVLLGVWVLGEPMNAWIGMGTVLVLGGVYVASQQGEKNGLRHTG